MSHGTIPALPRGRFHKHGYQLSAVARIVNPNSGQTTTSRQHVKTLCGTEVSTKLHTHEKMTSEMIIIANNNDNNREWNFSKFKTIFCLEHKSQSPDPDV